MVAVAVATTTTTTTAQCAWGQTPGPLKKSREMPMALMMWLMSKLQAATAEVTRFRVPRGSDRDDKL